MITISQIQGVKKVLGMHVYGELYGCDVEKLMDEKYLVEVVKNASKIGGFTLLDVHAWKISPGVSVVGVVLESHITIHTWPELAFATVDVYTCGSRPDPVKAFKYIAEALGAKRATMNVARRDYVEKK